MTEVTYQNDSLSGNDFENQGKLPTGLNVLTILTIIWCVLSLIFAVWGFYSSKTSYENKDKALEQMQSASIPGWLKSIMPAPEHFIEMTTKNYENRLPILILSLIALALCFVGALQMRKRKKQGYLLYIIGELLPFFTTAFFIGTFMLSSVGSIIIIVIALLFILLYTMQRKYLIY